MFTLLLMSALFQVPESKPQSQSPPAAAKDNDRRDNDDVAAATPEQALRTFHIAMLSHDEATLRAVTLPTDDFDWLLKGDVMTADQVAEAKQEIHRQTIRTLKVGDEVKLPGNRRVTVQPTEVTADRAVLLIEGASVPSRIWKVEGSWQVDARPVIEVCKAAHAAIKKKASSPDAAINVTLNGRWSGNALDETKITYEFTPDGSVTWFVEEENFKKLCPRGLSGHYKIRIADPVWEIDITDFEHPRFKGISFLGLVSVIDAKSFQLEGRPGQRPKEFGKEATIFRAESAK